MTTRAPQRPDHDSRHTRDPLHPILSALISYMRLLPPAASLVPCETTTGLGAPPPSPCVEPIPRGTETVLIVEDDDMVRTLLGRTLRGLGYVVHLAASGAEALALHAAHGAGIDAVLCDVVMPDISGPETVARMLDRGGRAPAVVFMSGHTDHALLRDRRLQCARHFMQKPLLRATIARTLRAAIDIPTKRHP